MDLSEFTLKDLLRIAMSSEVESRKVYLSLKERVDNLLLKDRFQFLADEEEKHRKYIERIFNKKFPKEEPELSPGITTPLPEIKADDNMPISEILQSAMDAEMAAREFYLQLSEKFEDEEINKMLKIFADMELGHYRLLEVEKNLAEKFEDYESMWPEFHVGP